MGIQIAVIGVKARLALMDRLLNLAQDVGYRSRVIFRYRPSRDASADVPLVGGVNGLWRRGIAVLTVIQAARNLTNRS